jgi:hypothetical protein
LISGTESLLLQGAGQGIGLQSPASSFIQDRRSRSPNALPPCQLRCQVEEYVVLLASSAPGRRYRARAPITPDQNRARSGNRLRRLSSRVRMRLRSATGDFRLQPTDPQPVTNIVGPARPRLNRFLRLYATTGSTPASRLLGPQCAFRKCAIQHLVVKAIPYRIAASSPSLDGLWAALLGGLGVTARTALNVPEGLMSAGSLKACFSRTSAHHSASQFALRRCSRRSHGRAPLPVSSVDPVFSVQRKCSP